MLCVSTIVSSFRAYIHLHHCHLKEGTALLKIKARAGNQVKGKPKIPITSICMVWQGSLVLFIGEAILGKKKKKQQKNPPKTPESRFWILDRKQQGTGETDVHYYVLRHDYSSLHRLVSSSMKTSFWAICFILNCSPNPTKDLNICIILSMYC